MYPGPYCVTQIKGTAAPTFDYALQSDVKRTLIFRQEFTPGNDAYAVRFWFSEGVWTRFPVNTPSAAPEYCWRPTDNVACQWTTLELYKQLASQKAQLDQQAAEKTQRLDDAANHQAAQNKLKADAAIKASQDKAALDQQQVAAAAKKNQDDIQRVWNDVRSSELRAQRAFLYPCNFSSNGCR
jgi:hypothetical protein